MKKLFVLTLLSVFLISLLSSCEDELITPEPYINILAMADDSLGNRIYLKLEYIDYTDGSIFDIDKISPDFEYNLEKPYSYIKDIYPDIVYDFKDVYVEIYSYTDDAIIIIYDKDKTIDDYTHRFKFVYSGGGSKKLHNMEYLVLSEYEDRVENKYRCVYYDKCEYNLDDENAINKIGSVDRILHNIVYQGIGFYPIEIE